MSKEDYEAFIRDARLDTASGFEAMRKRFADFVLTQPHRFAEAMNAPGSTGNYLKNAGNCFACFHAYDAEDCRWSVHVFRGAKDVVDSDAEGRSAEMIWNSFGCSIEAAHVLCSMRCFGSTFTEYSALSHSLQHCFGCVGLRNKKFCILNKPYAEDEYERITKAIREQLKRDQTYGEFFPPNMSAFGYNESSAMDEFPLTKDEALARGFKWEDAARGVFGKETVSWEAVPDSINDIGSLDVPKQLFACTACKKNFSVIAQEFSFLKRYQLPLPRVCPDCRHARRMQARGPNRLWHRQCVCIMQTHNHHQTGRCPNEFETSFALDRQEMIYCEQCYQTEVV